MHLFKIVISVVVVLFFTAAFQTCVIDLPRGRNLWVGFMESLFIDICILGYTLVCVATIIWAVS
jgi:hypothetical protein